MRDPAASTPYPSSEFRDGPLVLLAPEEVLVGVAAAALVGGRRSACGSAGDHSHALQVVGEDPKPGPGLGARQPAQAGAAQPEAALEVADPGLDADPPVPQPPEGPSPLRRQPRPARGAGALQPDPLDPKRCQRLVVGGGAEPAVADHRPGRPAGEH